MSATSCSSTNPTATSSPSPIPFVPFEDPNWFPNSSSIVYPLISCMSLLTLIYFVYYVYSTEYRAKRSLKTCFSSFNILLSVMLLSLTFWAITDLFSMTLYFSNVASTYVYYNNFQINAVNIEDLSGATFKASYLLFSWLRSRTLVQSNSKYAKTINWVMLYIIPLTMFSTVFISVYFTILNYQVEFDPTFNDYYRSYNIDTGFYDSDLASSFVLDGLYSLNNISNINAAVFGATLTLCSIIDLYFVFVFATFVTRTKARGKADEKLIVMSKYGLAASLTMLLGSMVLSISSYYTQVWNYRDTVMWVDAILLILMYATVLILTSMKISVTVTTENSNRRKLVLTKTVGDKTLV